MSRLYILLLCIWLISACDIVENDQEWVDQNMVLLDTTTNGEKYIIGDINSTNKLYVAKLKGTSYEMGKAFGTLFKAELKDQLQSVFSYYENQLEEAIATKLPAFVSQKIAGSAISLAKTLLDMNYLITKKYTNPRYYQEIKGIADGSGVSQKDLRRVNLISQIIKAACTVAGVWGPATSDRQTLHMRALDWDKNIPISKYPCAITYHPTEPNSRPHVNLAWVGLVGSLTGVSDKISLGEKVWYPPKGTVPMTRYGNPWTYVFRDLLYQATDLKSAVEFLNSTHRTCAIHIGVASVDDHSFRMFQYSYKTLNVYDDNNYNHYGPNHPKMPGLAYFDKHVQPSGDSCVGSVLANPSYYGKWNMEPFWRILGLSHQTGDTQLVVFDLENQKVMISYSEHGTGVEAYKRSPILLDLAQLFKPF